MEKKIIPTLTDTLPVGRIGSAQDTGISRGPSRPKGIIPGPLRPGSPISRSFAGQAPKKPTPPNPNFQGLSPAQIKEWAKDRHAR